MMGFISSLLSKIKQVFGWFWRLSLIKKAIIVIVIAVAGWFGFSRLTASSNNKPQYQTTAAERGILVASVTASGSVSHQGNSVNITTSATGIVQQVYVQNGDTVTQGQKIADITLDQDSSQQQASMWSSYLSAQNTLNAAKAKMNSLQSALFKANQAFINDKGVSNPTDQQKADPKYIQENADWLQAEADYNNQAGVIAAAQAALTSAWLSYQETSSTIIAPTAGVIANLSLTPGLTIPSSNDSSSSDTSTSSNTSNSSQTVGIITVEGGNVQASVNISEIDAPKIKPRQKATLTLDAFSGKTFTGKIASININGVVSSGVSNYPATIIFDSAPENIYQSMAVSATIITDVKDNVILVPNGAVQTNNGESTVRVLRNGQVTQVSITVGQANDTQTEIVSGISEGDTVVTGTTVPTGTGRQGQTTSPFSGLGGGRGFGGGGAVRIMR